MDHASFSRQQFLPLPVSSQTLGACQVLSQLVRFSDDQQEASKKASESVLLQSTAADVVDDNSIRVPRMGRIVLAMFISND